MIHWKREGEILYQGLSVYHPKDKHSAGFVLRIGNRMWRCRYSKSNKIWYTEYHKADPKAYEQIFKGIE